MASKRKIQKSELNSDRENVEVMSEMQLRGVRNYITRRERLNRALCSLNKWCPQGSVATKPCNIDAQDHTIQN